MSKTVNEKQPFAMPKNTKSGRTLLARLVGFCRKPRADQFRIVIRQVRLISALPFRLGRASLYDVFIAYHPDSQTFFGAHPEFKLLFGKFILRNRLNNAGDSTRLWSLILNIKQILSENIQGDFAELGVWRGNTSSVLAYFASHAKRRLVLFDTFEGFSEDDIKGIDSNKEIVFQNTSIDMVKNALGSDAGVCEFVKGHFPSSILDSHTARVYSVVSLDCDLYAPTKAGLEFFYPLMSDGAIFFLHDYSSLHWDGSRKAINDFCASYGLFPILMPDKSGSAFIRKSKKLI